MEARPSRCQPGGCGVCGSWLRLSIGCSVRPVWYSIVSPFSNSNRQQVKSVSATVVSPQQALEVSVPGFGLQKSAEALKSGRKR